MARFEILNGLKAKAGSPRLHDLMRVWFKQEIYEKEAIAFLLRDCRDHLNRVMHKRRMLIADMETMGDHGMIAGCLSALKKTMNRDYNMLNVLLELVLDTNEAIREHKGYVKKMKQH